jgi:AraC-like DNA-binding protein/mannose-6-phosphate isomerase-like protein (cupin superfamily)
MKKQFSTAARVVKEDLPPYSQRLNDGRHDFEPLLEHLAITPISAYHYNCSSDWQLHKRTLSNSYWSLITAGEGELMLKSRKIKIGAGQFIMFPAGMEHALTPVAGSCMSMINVHFQARVYNLIDICGLLELSGCFDDTVGGFTRSSKEAVRVYALKPPGWRSYLESLIRVQLFEFILNSAKEINSLTGELKKLSRIYPALELIENKFREPEFSAKDLADKLNISQVYTRKLFNELFGIAPTRFIHSRRIEYACILLRETELPIKNIAAQSGFNDLAFFYRIFARSMNLTPAQYRQTPQF